MSILSKLTSSAIPYWPEIKLGLIAASYGLAGGVGWEAHNFLIYKPHLARDAQQVIRVQAATARLNGATSAVATKYRDALEGAQRAAQTTTEHIIEKVPVYVHDNAQLPQAASSPGVAPVYSLPNGAVFLLDSAAAGVDPELAPSTGFDPDGPSGVTLSQAVSVISGNYGTCQQARDEVKAWHGWYNELVKTWPK